MMLSKGHLDLMSSLRRAFTAVWPHHNTLVNTGEVTLDIVIWLLIYFTVIIIHPIICQLQPFRKIQTSEKPSWACVLLQFYTVYVRNLFQKQNKTGKYQESSQSVVISWTHFTTTIYKPLEGKCRTQYTREIINPHSTAIENLYTEFNNTASHLANTRGHTNHDLASTWPQLRSRSNTDRALPIEYLYWT